MAVKNKVTASSLCKLLYNKIAPRLILRFGLSAPPWQNVFSVCPQQNFTNYYFLLHGFHFGYFGTFDSYPKEVGSGRLRPQGVGCQLEGIYAVLTDG